MSHGTADESDEMGGLMWPLSMCFSASVWSQRYGRKPKVDTDETEDERSIQEKHQQVNEHIELTERRIAANERKLAEKLAEARKLTLMINNKGVNKADINKKRALIAKEVRRLKQSIEYDRDAVAKIREMNEATIQTNSHGAAASRHARPRGASLHQ